MNPFKQKQLDEFTIEDCENYIEHYPYGEHINEVKLHLRTLRKLSSNRSETLSGEDHGIMASYRTDYENVEDKPNPVKHTQEYQQAKENEKKRKDAWVTYAKNTIGVIVTIFAIIIVIGVIKGNIRRSVAAPILCVGCASILKWCGWGGK